MFELILMSAMLTYILATIAIDNFKDRKEEIDRHYNKVMADIEFRKNTYGFDENDWGNN